MSCHNLQCHRQIKGPNQDHPQNFKTGVMGAECPERIDPAVNKRKRKKYIYRNQKIYYFFVLNKGLFKLCRKYQCCV